MILSADHPYNHVVIAISRGDKRRAATTRAPVHVPAVGDGRRIGWGDAESREDGVAIIVRAERDMGARLGPIGDSRLDDSTAGNLGDGYGRTYPAEVVSINQIRIAVLT